MCLEKKKRVKLTMKLNVLNFKESLSLADEGLSNQEMVSVGNPLLH